MGNVKGFAVGGSIYWSTEKIVQTSNLGNRGRRHHCFSGKESEIEGERVKEKRAEFEEEKVQKEKRAEFEEREREAEAWAASRRDDRVAGGNDRGHRSTVKLGGRTLKERLLKFNLRVGKGIVVLQGGQQCENPDRQGRKHWYTREDNNVKTQTDRGRSVGIPGPAEDEHHRHSATIVVVVTYSAGIEEVRRMVTEISGNELSEQKVWFSLKYDRGLVMALEGDADVRMFFKGNDEHGYFCADTSTQWMGIRNWVGRSLGTHNSFA
ncbi:LOW QUALITY PROTEIN: hypothetical protein Cgig2_019259 [Carnegiea gigantea]|uniref:Uncharacterized protein n=1 Tax=Carnegiea gigantea TaxID=171969 RepID=A0A9Q1KKY8_9CARY|nr:LOW QUALITY PROTEIN: hypothetical protein Cgig2_019259 [Carnegiea gigantea]